VAQGALFIAVINVVGRRRLDLAFRVSEYFDLPIELIFSTQPQKPLSQELLERQREKER
jgi:hypothetical protein